MFGVSVENRFVFDVCLLHVITIIECLTVVKLKIEKRLLFISFILIENDYQNQLITKESSKLP